MPDSQTNAICSKDTLVKVLAIIFLNPADRDREGVKIFIQDLLGCGCPDEVVEKAKVSFFVKPLGTYIKQRIVHLGPSRTLTPLEQEVNHLTKLPKMLKWPRRRSGELVPPALWRRPMLEAVAKNPKHREDLARLRPLSNVTIDAVIEVPARAFFFLVTHDTKKPPKRALLMQYESGQLLYKLMGYNRCRLFTISHRDEQKIIPQIDTALSWLGLYDAFFKRRDRYPFAKSVLDLFCDIH
ncbi:MAG: hypothetical protein JRI58_03455 [Deltaproteobacteria bacterium]|nr:hypothetical protein [Deltaproteobacteria bacterium]MBW2073790.1 hypothetical protein [Deltaproteobacteria bacterium]